jgi:hypothetical protein
MPKQPRSTVQSLTTCTVSLQITRSMGPDVQSCRKAGMDNDEVEPTPDRPPPPLQTSLHHAGRPHTASLHHLIWNCLFWRLKRDVLIRFSMHSTDDYPYFASTEKYLTKLTTNSPSVCRTQLGLKQRIDSMTTRIQKQVPVHRIRWWPAR